MGSRKMKIRKATAQDLSRIAEILVFVKRIKFRPIFKNDAYSFGELQVLSVAKEYGDPVILNHIWVYDDGIVKGMIRVEEEEIRELYVDYFFQNQRIGAELIKFAKNRFSVRFLWAIEKNIDAIRFYERHGFYKTDIRKLEEGTTEYLVKLVC
jgi:GNAT superfamily N-acetyltransferase